MRLLLDASAAVAAATGRLDERLLDRLGSATVVLAPDLFVAEVTNAFWKYVAAGEMSIDEAAKSHESAVDLVDAFLPVAAFAREVLREAAAHRHPAYDLCYAIAARREGASVLTIDRRLSKLLQTMRIKVINVK